MFILHGTAKKIVIELTKVAKILTAVDKGKKLKNKKIDNVLDDDKSDYEVEGINSVTVDKLTEH